MYLVVGLGNPGEEYAGTRHNAGFMVVDRLHHLCQGTPWQKKFRGLMSEGRDDAGGGAGRFLMLKPLTYMNVSGECARPAADFYKIPPENLVVVHDEMDLPMGTLKVKAGGGHGGHNGLRSLHQHLGPDYLRVRVGLGKPGGGGDKVVAHVLSGFSRQERDTMDVTVAEAADAVLLILRAGVQKAMNRFNTAPADRR